MKIYYQGELGSYSSTVSESILSNLTIKDLDLVGLGPFSEIWEKIDQENGIGILPIENSYAGPIHENLFAFLKYDAKIIGEYSFEIHHCLLSKETEISKIKKVYSHWQALKQCHFFFKKHGIEPIVYKDTAGAARMISENNKPGTAAIASEKAGEIYGLNNLSKSVQDQEGNTTRFLIVVKEDSKLNYLKKSGKISIIFEARDIQASLYKCLGAFATNNVNLTKIESLPNLQDPFNYLTWLDFEGHLNDENVKKAMHELEFFTSKIRILGEY